MALYETQEEMREIIIDAFDKQTGRGDFLRKMLLVGAGAGAGGAALVSASFELLRFTGLPCITRVSSFFQAVGALRRQNAVLMASISVVYL